MLKQKEKGSKRRLYKFSNLINDFDYTEFKEYTLNDVKGCLYRLDNPSVERLEEVEKDFHNTIVLKSFCEYAKEIKKTWLFIAY